MIINNYKKFSEKKNSSSNSSYDKKNYFNIGLPEGIDEVKKTIRIVPFKDENVSPFETSVIHNYKVDGRFQKFICPKHSANESCPMCETRGDLYELANNGDSTAKELAKKYNTSMYYNVKIIDRNDENHGIKIFRFPHSNDKKGIFDKIVDLIESYIKEDIDIIDPYKGYDLVLNIKRDSKGYPTVSSVLAKPISSKLSSDDSKIEEYLNDTRTWRDFFGVKSYDYLSIIAQGLIPVYDKVNKIYVPKDSLSNSNSQNNTPNPEDIIKGTAKGVNTTIQTINNQADDKNVTPKVNTENTPTQTQNFHEIEDDGEDDLPF